MTRIATAAGLDERAREAIALRRRLFTLAGWGAATEDVTNPLANDPAAADLVVVGATVTVDVRGAYRYGVITRVTPTALDVATMTQSAVAAARQDAGYHSEVKLGDYPDHAARNEVQRLGGECVLGKRRAKNLYRKTYEKAYIEQAVCRGITHAPYLAWAHVTNKTLPRDQVRIVR